MEQNKDIRLELLLEDNRFIKSELSKISDILRNAAVTNERLSSLDKTLTEVKERISDFETRLRSLEDTKLTAKGMINGASLVYTFLGTGIGAVLVKFLFS